MDDTEYLLSSPANAEALRHSLAQLERGEVVVFDSVDEFLVVSREVRSRL